MLLKKPCFYLGHEAPSSTWYTHTVLCLEKERVIDSVHCTKYNKIYKDINDTIKC